MEYNNYFPPVCRVYTLTCRRIVCASQFEDSEFETATIAEEYEW